MVVTEMMKKKSVKRLLSMSDLNQAVMGVLQISQSWPSRGTLIINMLTKKRIVQQKYSNGDS